MFQPTRGHAIIDNIFTNSEAFATITVTGNISDREPQAIELTMEKCSDEKPVRRRFITDANKGALYLSLLSETWQEAQSGDDPGSMFDVFLTTFMHHYNLCIPLKVVMNRNSKPESHSPVLFQIKETLDLIRETMNMYPGDEDLARIFRSYRKFYLQSCEDFKRLHYTQQIQQSQNRSKTVWRHIDNITGKRQRNLTDEQRPSCEDLSATAAESSFYFFPTDEQEILEIVQKLHPKKSRDHYDIDTDTVKFIAPTIAKVLANVINKCMEKGIFPDSLKIARVTPIYKKGLRSDPSSFRPISVLPAFSKIFEAVMAARISDYFEREGYLCDEQYGFRSGRGTRQAVWNIFTGLSSIIESESRCDAVVLDISKAFDCMNHNRFIDKMEKYGFRGVALGLLRSYLTNRKQYVVCGAESGVMTRVTIGVAQGSLIGPLFFIIYTSDLPRSISREVTLYADDTTILVRWRDDAARNAAVEDAKLVCRQSPRVEYR